MCEIYVECPKCQDKYNLLRTDGDNEQQLYSCESCGWEKTVVRPFHIGGWSVQLRQALAPLDVLQSLFTDQDVVKFLRPRLRGISHLSSAIPNFDLGDKYYQGEVDTAYQVYLNQMLVLAVTYAELIVKDFYYCSFLDQPKAINEILTIEGERKATVTLGEVIDADSTYELLDMMAERAAAKMSKGKINDVVSKLIRDCKVACGHPIAEELRLLNERRNQIVHEGKLDDVEINDVENSYRQVTYLLYVLGEAAIKRNLPLVDEVGFMIAFRETVKTKTD